MQWLRGVGVSSSGAKVGAATIPKVMADDMQELRVDNRISQVNVSVIGGVNGAAGKFGADVNGAVGKFGADDNGAANGFNGKFSASGGINAFGPSADVEAELQEMQESVEWQRPVPMSQTFVGAAAKRALLISAGLMATQQLSGINAVVFYTEDLFEAAASALESRFSVMVVGAVQLVSTVGSVLVVDRLGRRLLMMISNGAMALCTFLLGFYFFYR